MSKSGISIDIHKNFIRGLGNNQLFRPSKHISGNLIIRATSNP